MKNILFLILFISFGYNTSAQDFLPPDPKPKNFDFLRIGGFLWLDTNDTTGVDVSRSGILIFRRQPGDTALYVSNGRQFVKVGKDPDLSAYYTKLESDARFKPIAYVPTWTEITGKPATFPPSAHTHPISDVTGLQTALDSKINTAEKAAANGVATLGANGKIPSNQIPALAISETFVVASQAAMLGLTAETGDVAVRTDLSKSFILSAEPPSTLGNWQELLTPTAPVQSVNGQTGNVSLTKSDVGLGNVDNTSDANKPVSTAQQAALNTKEPLIPGGLPTQYWSGSKAWADFTQSARGAFSAGSGINITNGVITNTAPAPATPSWQQTLTVNNVSTGLTAATYIDPTLSAGLYGSGNFEARSNTYPSYGFHRPGNSGMALYLGTLGSDDLRIRTTGNVDYRVWHDGYAPVPAQTLQQVTTAGNTTNQTVVIGNHTFGTSRILVNSATDDGVTPLLVNGNSLSLGSVNSLVSGVQTNLTGESGLGKVGTVTNHPLAFVSFGTERMRVTETGNVGIGTTTPDARLTVSSGNIQLDANDAAIYTFNRATSAYGVLRLQGSYVRIMGNAENEIMRAQSNGNVGIGVTTPTSKLHVDGTITAPTLTSPSGTDLSLTAPSSQRLLFNPGGVNRGVWDSDGRLGIGQTPSSIRASMLEVNGNVWATDSYTLGSGNTPIGEFGLDGNVFLRSMGAQHINFLTNNSTQRAQINATSGNLILENQIQIKGGSPGAGKVLTSDGSGVASWQTAATGNVETIGTVYGDGSSFSQFPTGVTEIILNPTSNNTIELSSAAQYPGPAGRVVRIYNATSFTYLIAGTTRTARRCDIVWTSANNPSFYFY